jgi:hypothetical protein
MLKMTSFSNCGIAPTGITLVGQIAELCQFELAMVPPGLSGFNLHMQVE